LKGRKKILELLKKEDVCPHIERIVRVIVSKPVRVTGDDYGMVYFYCEKCDKSFALPDSYYIKEWMGGE